MAKAKAIRPDAGATARVDTGKTFWGGSTGRWAGEQLLRALKEGKPLNPATLRTADTLRKDEWIAFDEALIEEGLTRLRGVADLMAAGLVINIANAMGKTMLQWEKITDMEEAIVSLSGLDRSEDDGPGFELGNLPLPIIHKDFNINLRTLEASRTRGESLDDTGARVAGRKVAEKLENMLFAGGPTFAGAPIYGYTTHPNRNQIDYATAGEVWTAAGKDGGEMLTDVLAMISALEADGFYGPYWLYLPSAEGLKIENDFKAASDKSIRSRLMEVDRLQAIRTVDSLVTGNLIMVQATRDVVAMVNGVPLQTVQWDQYGGFQVAFKAFAIQVPLIRATQAGKSGVVHMHTL